MVLCGVVHFHHGRCALPNPSLHSVDTQIQAGLLCFLRLATFVSTVRINGNFYFCHIHPRIVCRRGAFRWVKLLHFDASGRLFKMLHQLSIGHLVQYAGFASFPKDAARLDRCDVIDELFADDGLFGLNPTLSELCVVLVPVKYQHKEP